VVSGPAGSGKTTLADPLAAELQLPLISKDSIKEALADDRHLGPGAAARVNPPPARGCGGLVLDTALDPTPAATGVEA
jgi:Ni2+-binding GTPase involved in maturation of urease and hydrogenase